MSPNVNIQQVLLVSVIAQCFFYLSELWLLEWPRYAHLCDGWALLFQLDFVAAFFYHGE